MEQQSRRHNRGRDAMRPADYLTTPWSRRSSPRKMTVRLRSSASMTHDPDLPRWRLQHRKITPCSVAKRLGEAVVASIWREPRWA